MNLFFRAAQNTEESPLRSWRWHELPRLSSLLHPLWYHKTYIRAEDEIFRCTTCWKGHSPVKCCFLPRNPFKKSDTSFNPQGSSCHLTFLHTENERMYTLFFFLFNKVLDVPKVLEPFWPSSGELISYKCTAADNIASTNNEIASSAISPTCVETHSSCYNDQLSITPMFSISGDCQYKHNFPVELINSRFPINFVWNRIPTQNSCINFCS